MKVLCILSYQFKNLRYSLAVCKEGKSTLGIPRYSGGCKLIMGPYIVSTENEYVFVVIAMRWGESYCTIPYYGTQLPFWEEIENTCFAQNDCVSVDGMLIQRTAYLITPFHTYFTLCGNLLDCWLCY